MLMITSIIPADYTSCLTVVSLLLLRGPRVCELRRHVHTSVETGQHRTLLVQRLRTLPQDERTEQATDQTQAQAGECVCVRVCLSVVQCRSSEERDREREVVVKGAKPTHNSRKVIFSQSVSVHCVCC